MDILHTAEREGRLAAPSGPHSKVAFPGPLKNQESLQLDFFSLHHCGRKVERVFYYPGTRFSRVPERHGSGAWDGRKNTMIDQWLEEVVLSSPAPDSWSARPPSASVFRLVSPEQDGIVRAALEISTRSLYKYTRTVSPKHRRMPWPSIPMPEN